MYVDKKREKKIIDKTSTWLAPAMQIEELQER